MDPARRVRERRHAVRVSRRPTLAVAVLATVASGLAVRSAGAGQAGPGGPLDAVRGPVGDGLYAVLVYLLLALLAPRARPLVLGAVAWAACAAVELAQLTGLPAAVVDAWDPARWVLGTTFHAPDLVSYAVGAALAALLDGAVARRRAARGPRRGGGPVAAGQRARDAGASEPPPDARRSTR